MIICETLAYPDIHEPFFCPVSSLIESEVFPERYRNLDLVCLVECLKEEIALLGSFSNQYISSWKSKPIPVFKRLHRDLRGCKKENDKGTSSRPCEWMRNAYGSILNNSGIHFVFGEVNCQRGIDGSSCSLAGNPPICRKHAYFTSNNPIL